MNKAVREILFYQTRSGERPVEEFLNGLPGKQTQKIAWVLQLIEELEHVPAQYLKKLTGTRDLWEIRVQSGSDAYRLLGFFETPSRFVLTNGFLKKSEKIPRKEIDLAEQRKTDYSRRSS